MGGVECEGSTPIFGLPVDQSKDQGRDMCPCQRACASLSFDIKYQKMNQYQKTNQYLLTCVLGKDLF